MTIDNELFLTRERGIEVNATEQAKCTCKWCSEKHEAKLQPVIEYQDTNRLPTTGEASRAAVTDAIKHLRQVGLRKVDDISDATSKLKNGDQYTFEGHTVSIELKASAKQVNSKSKYMFR